MCKFYFKRCEKKNILYPVGEGLEGVVLLEIPRMVKNQKN